MDYNSKDNIMQYYLNNLINKLSKFTLAIV